MSFPMTLTTIIVLIVVLFPDWLTTSAFRIHQSDPLPKDFFPIHSTLGVLEDKALTNRASIDRPTHRHKRLMGIFRCNGWGPGCTQLESANARGTGGGGGGRGGGEGPTYRGGESTMNRSPIERFQPFFTLTSGGSWGPTGKRSPTPDRLYHQREHLPDSHRTEGRRSYELLSEEPWDNTASRERMLLKAIETLLVKKQLKLR